MDVQRQQIKTSKLLQLTPIDTRTDFDERLDRFYFSIQNLITNLSESEAHDVLQKQVHKSPLAHEEVCIGLLVGILTEPENASRYYRDLTLLSRDGLELIIRDLNILILDRYLKLDEICKLQLIWILREILKNNIINADRLIFSLLRQIIGGDVSTKNVWLVESTLDLLIENRIWLEKHSILVATVVYTYLRLIEDHINPVFNNLRQKEIDFCICLLREKFTDCLMIGRDLIRLLQNVARIPEFEALWKDIHSNPQILSSQFTGVLQLMQTHTRTSKTFIRSRLTPDMERKLNFLFSNVKFGQQKRYQEWFQRQYLNTPESQSLRCDLIRFICCCIHPTNEILSSDIIPRWAVIGWIISTCTCNVAAANAKLALFYDWLFFDPDRDKKDIMNIEPAILCMFQSIKSHPQMTVTLLDFLCRIMDTFYPPLVQLTRNGIKSALSFILAKKVVNNLSILFENPKIDVELRSLVRERFPEFCTPNNELINQQQQQQFFIQNNIEQPINNNGFSNGQILNNNSNNNNMVPSIPNNHELTVMEEDDVKFNLNYDSDDDSQKLMQPQLCEKSYVVNFDFNQSLDNLNTEIRTGLLSLKREKNKEKRCESMLTFIQQLIQEELDQPSLEYVAKCLTIILKDDLTKKVYSKVNNYLSDDENLEKESIKLPLFVLLKDLIQRPEEESTIREQLIYLISEMQKYSKCIGYLLIYLNRIVKPNDQTMSAYRDLSKQQNKDLNECLEKDLELCQFEETDLFCFLVVDIFKIFSNVCIDNPAIIYLIVSTVDALQLQEFICQIIQGNLVLFKKESILSVINASLEWETFEQICLWKLIDAHDISLNYILPVLSKLEYQTNSEALAHITLMLKNEEPNDEYLKCILDRDCKKHDYFTISVLRCWARDHCDKLAELVAARLNKNLSGAGGKGKKKTNQKTNITWSAEQILVHLDFYREKIKDDMFFSNETIQTALTNVQSSCSELQKSKFNELFSLIEDMEHWSNSKLNKKESKVKIKKKRTRKGSSSESDQSQDELTTNSPTKSKTAVRKKKQKVVLESDSD